VYAPTAELQEEARPILHVLGPVPAAVIAVVSTEAYVASSQALADIMTAAGSHVQFLSLEGEDHRGSARQLGEDNGVLVKVVIGMIKAAPQPAH
jgi:hypothetical protein